MSNNTAAAAKSSPANLVWIDCEMTGLDENVNRIIEIACIVTDSNLNVISPNDQPFDLIIHHDEQTLASMSDWCRQNLDPNLLQQVRTSTITTEQAEKLVIQYIQPYITAKQSILCGNSIHADKLFLRREFPNFLALLHYRLIDVSTVKELVSRWLPGVYAAAPVKQGKHRALDDIRESIAELRYYKEHAFVLQL